MLAGLCFQFVINFSKQLGLIEEFLLSVIMPLMNFNSSSVLDHVYGYLQLQKEPQGESLAECQHSECEIKAEGWFTLTFSIILVDQIIYP